MDAANDLVEAFLRANGYLTLSELQVQFLSERGDWETLTDVDILAIRFPGPIYMASPGDDGQDGALEIPGVPLFLEEDTIDVIVGEVKQGDARFNPSIADQRTLRTALHRLAWLYVDDDLEQVVEDLGARGVCYSNARGGGRIRTRLVAFGRADETTLNVVPMERILERFLGAFDQFDSVLRSARASSDAVATLKLIHKAGFRLSRDS